MLIAYPPHDVVQFSASSYSTNEDNTSFAVGIVRLNPGQGVGMDVRIQTQDITAIAGVNYTELDDTIGLAPAGSGGLGGAGITDGSILIELFNRTLGVGNSRTFLVKILPDPNHVYLLGSLSQVIVTMNGVGTAATAGTLRFSSSAYEILENAGTDAGTVNILRQGATGTPPTVSVTVASTNGSAISGTDYTAINTSKTWTSPDVTDKNVAVTVVDRAGAQGDRAFTLTLSAPTGGATLGTPSVTTVTIRDAVAVPVGAWPRRCVYSIGAGAAQDYSLTSTRQGVALTDFSIWQWLPARGAAQYRTDAQAVRALNSAHDILLYRNWAQVPRDETIWAAHFAKLTAQTGVPGLSQAPNDWLCQNSAGVQVTFGGLRMYYNFDNCVADSNGDTCPEWLAGWMSNVCDQVGLSYVGVFWDNFGPYEVSVPNFVTDSSNVDKSRTSVAVQELWRDAQLQGMTKFRALNATRLCLGNSGTYAGNQINGSAHPAGTINGDLDLLNLDGSMFEKPGGETWSKFGLRPSGTTIINETAGSFAQGLAMARHSGFSKTLFRRDGTTADPYTSWPVKTMSDANMAGAGKTEGRKYGRYFMSLCWVLTDHYIDLRAGYGDVAQEWDEFYGVSVPGTFAAKFAARKWMGNALEQSQGAPRSLGVYWREFQNALVVMNPEGNGTQTITLPSAGAGFHWERINGTQDATVNDGSTLGATLQITDQNGLIIKRVAN